MMRIGRQRDVSEEICAYERRCLTCVNHDSSCIQCITTYTSLKMVMTRAGPVWYSEQEDDYDDYDDGGGKVLSS